MKSIKPILEHLSSPPIYGLVLAGGMSKRMGIDKGKININNQELRIKIFKLLKPHVDQCYFSGRSDQKEELAKYPFIEDTVFKMGPYGALITAFMTYPEVTWLIVACDMALIEDPLFVQLIEKRNPNKIATAFYNDQTGFVETMPSIWEPDSYPTLLHYLSNGVDSLQRVLRNSDIEQLTSLNPNLLFNMNTPDDARSIGIEIIK